MAERLENCLNDELGENAIPVKTLDTCSKTKRPRELYCSLVLALELCCVA